MATRVATEIETEIVTVTTTGADGSATGSGTTSGKPMGFLLGVHLDYHASCPATADVTLSYTTRGGTITVVTDNATDGLYLPRKQVVSSAGAAISGVYDYYPLDGGQTLTVSVAGANALTGCVVAYVYYLR